MIYTEFYNKGACIFGRELEQVPCKKDEISIWVEAWGKYRHYEVYSIKWVLRNKDTMALVDLTQLDKFPR